LSPTYGELTPFPTRINEIGDSLLKKLQHRKQPPPHPPHEYPGLPRSATREEHELYASNGPLWYRGWATDSEEQVCKDVETVLAKTGTRRMVMGHTPDFQVLTHPNIPTSSSDEFFNRTLFPVAMARLLSLTRASHTLTEVFSRPSQYIIPSPPLRLIKKSMDLMQERVMHKSGLKGRSSVRFTLIEAKC